MFGPVLKERATQGPAKVVDWALCVARDATDDQRSFLEFPS